MCVVSGRVYVMSDYEDPYRYKHATQPKPSKARALSISLLVFAALFTYIHFIVATICCVELPWRLMAGKRRCYKLRYKLQIRSQKDTKYDLKGSGVEP